MSIGQRRLSLSRAIVWFASSYTLSMLGYLGMNAIAGRMLGPAGFGPFVVILTACTLLGQVGLVGVNRAGLREAARLENEDVEGLRGLRRDMRAVALTSLPFVAVLSGLIAFAMAPGELWNRLAIAAAVVVLVLAGAQQRAAADFLRGWGQVRTASLLEGRSGGALVFLCQGVALAAVYVLVPDAGLEWAVGAAAVGLVLPVVWARSRMSRVWGHLDAPVRPLHDLVRVARRDWKFAGNQVATFVNAHLELWIAVLLLTATSTSLLSAALRLAMLLTIPMNALQVVFAPAVSRLLHRGATAETEALLRTGATLGGAFTVPLWIPMVVVPSFLLELLFGGEFSAASTLLVVLTLGFIVNALVGMCGIALVMGHQEGAVAVVQWTGVVTRLVAGAFTAYFFGPIGLALSAAVITALLQVALWLVVRRRLGFSTHATTRPQVKLVRTTAS